jgi:hypothetical protein
VNSSIRILDPRLGLKIPDPRRKAYVRVKDNGQSEPSLSINHDGTADESNMLPG